MSDSFTYELKYLSNYPQNILEQVSELIRKKELERYLKKKYPFPHTINSNKALHSYVQSLKNTFLKHSKPLNRIVFDKKVSILYDALGINSTIRKVHGKKIKVKNEIIISTIFQKGPKEFLKMIVVHELAHLKERDHDKNFYQLCRNMEENYHQFELDLRIYLTQLDLAGDIYD